MFGLKVKMIVQIYFNLYVDDVYMVFHFIEDFVTYFDNIALSGRYVLTFLVGLIVLPREMLLARMPARLYSLEYFLERGLIF